MRNNRGDTIIEVMIAIGVAAFAIGTSYAIANQSLQRAITSRERNQAINLIQNQVAALEIREKTNPTNFDSQFGVPADFSPASTPAIAIHFCLDSQSSGPSDNNHPWVQQVNPFNNDSQAATLSQGTPGYNGTCIIANDGTNYYIDIAAEVTASSDQSKERTVYQISVRWSQVGTGAVQQSTVFYRF